jgi:hypothetical protein
MSTSPELRALIVLGHNASPFIPVECTRRNPDHLTPISKLNILAAGLLCLQKVTDKLILSTGQTIGSDMPSDAYAMDEYFSRQFPQLSHIPRILEIESFDTAGNAKHTLNIVPEGPYGLISIKKHAENAAKLFINLGHRGLKGVYYSEFVYANHLNRTRSPGAARTFLKLVNDYSLLSGISLREHIRAQLINSIDPYGQHLRPVTTLTRRILTH